MWGCNVLSVKHGTQCPGPGGPNRWSGVGGRIDVMSLPHFHRWETQYHVTQLASGRAEPGGQGRVGE